MVKSAGSMSMSFGAVGGLLVFSAIHGYFPLVIPSIFFFIIAYRSYTLDKCKYAFVIISACNFIVGNGLYFLPHTEDGGLQEYGILVAVVVIIVSMIALLYIIRLEENREKS